MNTKAINKDNVGSTTLLAGMFLTIAVAMFSGSADAKATAATNAFTKAQASTPTATKITTDSLVITATRLK